MLTPEWSDDEPIETIYLGGGTPSILSKDALEEILQTVREKFYLSPHLEICLEANPDDITEKALQDWKSMGVNRLSVGIQSFDEAELRWMNRAHTATESLHCLNLILSAGYTNFSIDLIYGSPLQTDEILRKNIDTVIRMKVPHISAYALTVESGTALHHRMEKKEEPGVDADHQAAQFEILLASMRDAGYEQYEISNFCLPGFRSLHNSSYWKGKPYYGFGASAHAYDGIKTRRWNIANNSLYIQSLEAGKIPYEEEILTGTQQLNEAIMISLRTLEGIDLDKINERFGPEKGMQVLASAKKFIELQQVEHRNNRLVLTDSGRFLADGIAAAMFE